MMQKENVFTLFVIEPNDNFWAILHSENVQ